MRGRRSIQKMDDEQTNGQADMKEGELLYLENLQPPTAKFSHKYMIRQRKESWDCPCNSLFHLPHANFMFTILCLRCNVGKYMISLTAPVPAAHPAGTPPFNTLSIGLYCLFSPTFSIISRWKANDKYEKNRTPDGCH